MKEGKTITKMSKKFINRQKKFMAHLLRAEGDVITKACTINRNGLKISAGFRRTGKPTYDQVGRSGDEFMLQHTVTMGLLLPNWREDIRIDEAKQIVLQTATDREL